LTASSSISVNDAIQRFLEHCRVAKGLAPHTLRAYGCDLDRFVGHVGGSTPANAIGRESLHSHARGLLDVAGLRETSVRRHMATLKAMFHWMERETIVPWSAFRHYDFSIRVPIPLPRSLDSHEMRLLLRAAARGVRRSRGGDRYWSSLIQLAVVGMFTTGVRIGELVSVRLPDISFEEGMIRIRGKGRRERQVYLPGVEARAVLDRYMSVRCRLTEVNDRLLVSPSGASLSAQCIRRRLRFLAERAGIPRKVTPHMLRHTAATQLIEAGVDIRFVQKLLGHASIATTQIYADVRDSTLRATLTRANTLARLA
jgi:site-specific recombinase XerD